MKILVVEPSKKPYTKEIEGTLKSMQEIVKGLIEPIYIDNDAVIIVNEEGKLIGLPPNRIIYNEHFQDIIFGTCFICLAPADSEDFESLPDDLLDMYTKKFSMILAKV